MDIATCTLCKSKDLLEFGMDDIPAEILMGITPALCLPPPPPSSASSLVSSVTSLPSPQPDQASCLRTFSPTPMEVSIHPIEVNNNPISIHPIGVAQKRKSRVVLPQSMQPQPKSPASPGSSSFQSVTVATGARYTEAWKSIGNIDMGINLPCICGRSVNSLLCTFCGYFSNDQRKFVPCPQHPEVIKPF